MNSKNFIYIATILIIGSFFIGSANSQSTSIYSWLNNQTIHYTQYAPISIKSVLNLFLNGSYFYKVEDQYYLNSSIYPTTKKGTEFALAKQAYPFPFIQNMIKDNVSYCTENTIPINQQNNSTIDFFFSLCNINKENSSELNNISENSSISANQIKELAQDFMPTDNFTKELYHLYYQYSSICKYPSTQVSNSSIFINSYCSGTKDNISIPNPVDYNDFYQSLYDYMQSTENNNNIPFLELKYDINNGTIFPRVYNGQPIQSYSAIVGIYPGILPSGIQATKMAENATIILPIKTINNTEAVILGLNGMNITSGVYSNVTLFAGVQEVNNSYATYNVSTNQAPFEGETATGYETYQNSCQSSPGLGTVESNEQSQLEKEIFSGLYSDNFYPTNFVYKYATGEEAMNYTVNGASIIQASVSNETVGNTTIVYGVFDPTTLKTTFENSTSENIFSTSTKLLSLPIPKTAFTNSKMIVFLNTTSPLSYQMSYYQFKENIGSPSYNFSHYSYQEQKFKTVTKKIGNTTVKEQVPYFVTCYVQQVATSVKYNSTKTLLSTQKNNYNINNSQTLNVSTNLSISKLLNPSKTNLNYSYTYYLLNSGNNTTKEFTKITIPLMSSFELFSSNNTMLYSFDSYQFDNNLITSNFTNKLASISKYIYAYDPSYVYPNSYATIPALYPTIEDSYTNTKYLIGIAQLESNPQNTNMSNLLLPIPVQLMDGFSAVFGNLESSSTKVSYSESVAINNVKEFTYYENGCSGGRIGNSCIINQNYYSYGENSSSKTIYHNYDLLNPAIYSQNSFYAGEESPYWLCLKASIFGNNLGLLFSCLNPTVNNMSHIYITTNYLNFNTSYGNMTPQEKQEFYNYLENATQNNSQSNAFYDEYSYIHAPTYASPYANYVKKTTTQNIANETIQYNSNGTMTLSFSTAFPSIEIIGCDYQVCFNNYLSPTNATINGFYSDYPINNTAFFYSIEPPSLEEANVSINQLISITANNQTKVADVSKYFIINYINKNSTNTFTETNKNINGTLIPVINVIYPINYYSSLSVTPKVFITFYNNTIYNSQIKYVFNQKTTVLYFINYKKQIIFYILISIIIFAILYYLGVFKEIKTGIQARIEKYKAENF